MKYTVKLSKNELKWLTKFDDKFHVALTKIKLGCTDYKDIISKLEDLDSQIKELKPNY